MPGLVVLSITDGRRRYSLTPCQPWRRDRPRRSYAGAAAPRLGMGAARRSGADQDDGVFGSLLTDSIHQSWFISLGQQLSELFRGKRKLPRVRGYDRRALAASEEAGISRLVIESVREPWYRSLKLYFRSRMREKKLPPLRLSSRPIAVKSIWGTYDYKQQGVSWSAGGSRFCWWFCCFTVFSGTGFAANQRGFHRPCYRLRPVALFDRASQRSSGRHRWRGRRWPKQPLTAQQGEAASV